ncbi:ATP-binding protein (plasmid) [Tistrella mobilis]|uniref:ATP-binding protein n=1 Tax=Tistrella mobilis TaxID=171437 RepID=UPI0035569DBD
MKRVTMPRPTLQIQIMVIILIGLAVVDTFGPILERQIKSLSTLPDLKQVARQVGVVADLVEDSPPAERDAVLAAARRSGWVLSLAAPETADRLVTGLPEDGVFDRLTSWLFMPEDIDPPVGGWRTFLDETRVMVLKIDQGQTLLVATLDPERMILRDVSAQVPYYLLAIVTLGLLFAAFSAHVITRPLRRIATAAAGADLSGGTEIFEERGSIEIVMLARALNRMRRRIVTMVESRTRMLRGISHDLRTPLTRIRLRADRVADADLRAALLADVGRLEALLDESLAYLRDDHAREAVERVDVASTLQTICSDFADIGHDITFHGPNRLVARCRPLALGRAVSNLCENATRFACRTDVTLTAGDGVFVIEVADNGPGIPPDKRARVLEPFFKLDTARQDGGTGFGLGLAIVAEIVQAHRGQLELLDNAPQGLRVRMTIPVG